MKIVSDGGPDHRVTFGSVKIAHLCLFRALNLEAHTSRGRISLRG